MEAAVELFDSKAVKRKHHHKVGSGCLTCKYGVSDHRGIHWLTYGLDVVA